MIQDIVDSLDLALILDQTGSYSELSTRRAKVVKSGSEHQIWLRTSVSAPNISLGCPLSLAQHRLTVPAVPLVHGQTVKTVIFDMFTVSRACLVRVHAPGSPGMPRTGVQGAMDRCSTGSLEPGPCPPCPSRSMSAMPVNARRCPSMPVNAASIDPIWPQSIQSGLDPLVCDS